MNYILVDNKLVKQKTDGRIAHPVNVRTYTTDDLVEAIVKRNMGISKAEVLAMVEAENEIQKEWLAAGNSINRQLIHYHPSIPGTYEKGKYPSEAMIRITASKELAELAKKIPLRHVEPTGQIFIDFVYDVKSDSTNEKVTAGGTVKITGYNLKITGADPSVGIEFINVIHPDIVYPIEAVDIITNNPSELLIVAPAGMTVGDEVFIKVTTQYSRSKTLKMPRSIMTLKAFTVV
jgi:hypothetical protein